MIRHKFNAKPTTVGNRNFGSKKEAAYYEQLLLARRSGDLIFFLWQVPFHLQSGVRYVVDFVEFWKDGSVRFVDVKGFKTPVYEVKKKQVMVEYPIEILEV